MTTLNVKIHNEQEEKVLLAFLNSLDYDYEPGMQEVNEIDTTEYLLSGEAMKKHLEESIQEAKEEKVTSIPLRDLWK